MDRTWRQAAQLLGVEVEQLQALLHAEEPAALGRQVGAATTAALTRCMPANSPRGWELVGSAEMAEASRRGASNLLSMAVRAHWRRRRRLADDEHAHTCHLISVLWRSGELLRVEDAGTDSDAGVDLRRASAAALTHASWQLDPGAVKQHAAWQLLQDTESAIGSILAGNRRIDRPGCSRGIDGEQASPEQDDDRRQRITRAVLQCLRLADLSRGQASALGSLAEGWQGSLVELLEVAERVQGEQAGSTPHQ